MMALRDMLSRVNHAVNRLEMMNQGRIMGPNMSDKSAESMELVVSDGFYDTSDTPHDVAMQAQSVPEQTKHRQPKLKRDGREKPKASLDWRTKWSYARNISQLFSNAMRHRADDLGLKFRPDGYVEANEFIRIVSHLLKDKTKLTVNAIKNIIEVTDKEKMEDKQDESWVFVANTNLNGMNTRQQFTTESGVVYIRCMNGHDSKFYGELDGQIRIGSIFEPLDVQIHSVAFHDTRFEFSSSIDSVGLRPGDRFVHLWIEGGKKGGRENMDLTYRINTVAASDNGIAFWKAANDVVLVDGPIPPQFFTDCRHNMEGQLTQRPLHAAKVSPELPSSGGVEWDVADSFVEFEKVSDNDKDAKLMEFARDLLCNKHIGKDPTMKLLAEVLRASLQARFGTLSPKDQEQLSDVSDALTKLTPQNYLEDDPRNITLDLPVFYSAQRQVYIIMPKGKKYMCKDRRTGKRVSSDAQLVQLGNAFGFPRGFPILWKPKTFIDARGFYPKFQNDEEDNDNEDEDGDGVETEGSSAPVDTSIFDNAKSLEFFKKWSGFLLHVIAFTLDDKLLWTVCSKNFADCTNRFVQYGRELVTGLMTEELAATLAKECLYLGGEALHVDDEHGYVVKKNALVVTCVGRGSRFDLHHGSRKGVPGEFTHYWSLPEVVQFCSEYRLGSDTSYTILGSGSELREFALNIFKERDTMRDSDFNSKIVQINDKFEVQKYNGTMNHNALVGDVLEGFVLHIKKTDDSSLKKKVKLPFYTWRTFFLRKWLGSVVGENSARVQDKRFITQDCVTRMNRYVKRWCHTHADLFRNLIKCAAVKLQFEWKTVLDEYDGEKKRIAGRIHVIIADAVENLYFSQGGGEEAIQRYAERFDAVFEGKDSPQEVLVDVCLCLGPIGSGKSTIMRRLAAQMQTRYEAIDGDVVFETDNRKEDLKLTRDLSAERNPATMGRIWRAILRGKIPVISHGGGVFVGAGRGRDPVCTLKDRIREVFGVNSRLTVVLMRNASSEDATTNNRILELSREGAAKAIDGIFMTKDDEARLKFIQQVAVHRERVGEWGPYDRKNPKKAHDEKMSRISLENAAKAALICGIADRIFTAPYIPDTANESSWQHSVTNSSEMGNLITRGFGRNFKRSGEFDQIRAVVKKVGVEGEAARHVTLMYARQEGVEITAEQYLELEQKLVGRIFHARQYMVQLHPAEAAPKLFEHCNSDGSRFDQIDVSEKEEKMEDAYQDCKKIVVSKITNTEIEKTTRGEKKLKFLDDDSNVLIPQPNDCEHESLLHVTEECSVFSSRESVNAIKWLDSPHPLSSMELQHRQGAATKTYVFDGRRDSQVKYQKLFTNTGTVRAQRKINVVANYAIDPAPVQFRCVGVSIFRHADAR